MSLPLVSVIIPVFNREKHIRRAVESIFEQTFREYELIVVDDASTDNTPTVLQAYENRLSIVHNASNTGLPAKARNRGMAEAKGDYIAFLDSDDFWYPTKLEKQVAFMERSKDCLLSHTFCHVVDEQDRVLYVRREAEMPQEGDLVARLIRECFITTSTVMVRRSLIDAIGGFNEQSMLKRGEDREFFLRAATNGPIGFVPDILAAHRKSSDSVSGSGFEFQCSILRTQKWIMLHPELWINKVSKNVPIDAFVSVCLDFFYYWRARKAYRKALYFYWRAIKESPFHRSLMVRRKGPVPAEEKALL